MWLTFDDDDVVVGQGSEPASAGRDLVGFARSIGFVPDARQEEVLRAKGKRVILNCSRQWGKSTVAAVVAVERLYRRPGSLVVVAAETERQSGELVRKVEGLLGRMGVKASGGRLRNGSRIVGLPGERGAVRGYSAVSLLLIDEAAQVPDSLYRTLRPMLAVSDGDLWLMSTPFGRRGFFYDAWADGGPEWERFAVPATECPRIPREFLAEEERELGPVWFRQEYLCEFVESGEEVFARWLVEGAVRDIEILRV